MHILNTAIITSVIMMIISDFKKRRISLIWLGIFGLSVLYYCLSTEAEYLDNIITNLIVIGIITAFTMLYLILKNKQLINPLNGYIGIGDLWFIICLIPLWKAKLLLIFLITSFVFAILWWLTIKLIYSKNRTIPLVGIMGITFLFYHTYEIIQNAGF